MYLTISFTPSSDEMKIIKLNVGGELFMTYRSTIIKSTANYLINLIDEKSSQEEIFIDRNNELFRDIILYLRVHTIFTKDLKKLHALEKEAKFYDIQKMVDDLQVAIAEAEKLEQEKQNTKPKVVLKDIHQMYTSFNQTTTVPSKYKIIEEKGGVSQSYSLIDIVYVKDINRCYDHSKAYCSCSSTPKLVLIPERTH